MRMRNASPPSRGIPMNLAVPGLLGILGLLGLLAIERWRPRLPSLEAQGAGEPKPAPLTFQYRVLQDRDLYAEASAPTKADLEARLDRLAAQGWEPLNPVLRYFPDRGFLVVTGGSLETASFPSREAALLLRRPRTR